MSTAPVDIDASTSLESERALPRVSPSAVFGALLVALAHIPVLWAYVSSLYSLPHYGYIASLPIFAAVLAYGRVRHLGELVPGRMLPALAWFFPAMFLLAAGSVFDSPWLSGISSFWAIMAASYAIGSGRLALAVAPAWVMLCLAIRLPLLLDERLVRILQSVAARRASELLHYIGQAHILDGNVVETPVKRYLVEEACSGVQSLFAITACTVFYILWTRMAWWRSILILAVCWFWVWLANVARVVLVTYLNSTLGWPVDTGTMHDALGVGLFIFTLGMILSTAHLIWFFLPYGIFGGRDGTEESADLDAASGPPTSLAATGQTAFASPILQIAYLALLVFVWLPQWRVPYPSASPVQLNRLEESFAPEQFRGWKRVDGAFQSTSRAGDSQWGARSQTWLFTKESKQITVSLDYPFLGWHELATCYDADGWSIDDRTVAAVPRVAELPEVIGPDEQFVKTSMRRPEKNDYGFVVYQCFNDRKIPIPVPNANVFRVIGERLKAYKQRLLTMGASGSGMNDQVRSYQLQVKMQDHAEFLQADRDEATALFVQFRILLDKTLSSASTGGAP